MILENIDGYVSKDSLYRLLSNFRMRNILTEKEEDLLGKITVAIKDMRNEIDPKEKQMVGVTVLADLHRIREECKYIQHRDHGRCTNCRYCSKDENNNNYCRIIEDYSKGMPCDWVLPEITMY